MKDRNCNQHDVDRKLQELEWRFLIVVRRTAALQLLRLSRGELRLKIKEGAQSLAEHTDDGPDFGKSGPSNHVYRYRPVTAFALSGRAALARQLQPMKQAPALAGRKLLCIGISRRLGRRNRYRSLRIGN